MRPPRPTLQPPASVQPSLCAAAAGCQRKPHVVTRQRRHGGPEHDTHRAVRYAVKPLGHELVAEARRVLRTARRFRSALCERCSRARVERAGWLRTGSFSGSGQVAFQAQG
eukprot:365970-Chlamydomonas_euryale.AAC.4